MARRRETPRGAGEKTSMMSLLYEIFILPIEIIYRAIYLGSVQLTGNYGLSILVLSAVSAVAFIPLGRLAVGMQAGEKKVQQIMAPQLARIRSESKGAERQRRINRLYRRYAYHPLLAIRSAFGVALQIPFLTGAYYMILSLTQLQGQSFLCIADLSQPDGLLWGVNFLPILMTVVNITATFTTPGLSRKDRIQAVIIAFFFLLLLYGAASALLIFWTMNNVFFLLQNLHLPVKLPRFRKPAFAQGAMSTASASLLRSVYGLSCAGLAALLFLYVPFQTYASDPAFFASGPLDVLLGMVRYLSLTFFIVFVLWLWFPARGKAIPAFVAFWALCLAFVNVFVMPGDFGALDGTRFLDEARIGRPMRLFADALLPVLVALAAAAVAFAPARVRRALPGVLSIALFSLLVLTGYSGISSLGAVEEDTAFTPPPYAQAMQSYSRNGENVIVVIMDMFTGGHIEKMLDDPWFDDFRAGMDGFVWYPDTVSMADATILSLPSIYGGHGYSPAATNGRRSLTLEETVNKAFALMPRNFAAHDYDVSVINGLEYFNEELYARHGGKADNILTVPRVRRTFLRKYYDDVSLRDFSSFFAILGLFQASPDMFKQKLYDDGNWKNAGDGILAASMDFYKEEDAYFRYVFTSGITADAPRSTAKIFYTMLSHYMWHYAPDLVDGAPRIVADPCPETEGQLLHKGGVLPEHYYAERHLMRYLMIFFEQLKEAGVYDNSRIILVSDHGERDSQMVARAYNDGKEFADGVPYGSGRYAPGRPHALLMVKEPGKHGPLRIDEAFMSSADVPLLALKGIGQCDEFSLYDPSRVPTPRVLTHARGGARWSEHKRKAYIYEQHRLEGTLFDPARNTLEGNYD